MNYLDALRRTSKKLEAEFGYSERINHSLSKGEFREYIINRYDVRVHKNGWIEYCNTEDCKDGAVLYIKPENAAYIIDPIMSEFFCYDADRHGEAVIDGYHWKLSFYRKDQLVDMIEGWPGEDKWRHSETKRIVEYCYRKGQT